MDEAEVPTAAYIEFSAKNYNLAKEYIREKKYPCVIKADGLAAGKGVIEDAIREYEIKRGNIYRIKYNDIDNDINDDLYEL